MSYVGYFIGGPLDLTKTALQHPESTMYALERAALTLQEINNVQDYRVARNLIDKKHVYHVRPAGKLHGSEYDVFVYLYAGMESKAP